jgi:hypothetical protein
MSGYHDIFPPGLTLEDKAALMWKIEQDYRRCNYGALSCKGEYIAFAVNFYTRSRYSLEDVVLQYRAHNQAERRRSLAQAFMNDMKRRASALAVPQLQ